MEKENSKAFWAFEKLDEYQQRIIKMTDEKTILLAGPGTGKTTLIAHKIAYLLLSGVKPSEILLFTFTNKSANQIISTVEKITGINLRENKILAGTFHNICNTWLRAYANEIDVSPNYTIFDRHDAKEYMKLLSLNKNIDAFYTDYYLAHESILYSLYSDSINTCTPISELIEKQFQNQHDTKSLVEKFYNAYEREKAKRNILDFEDLISKTIKLLNEKPTIRSQITSQYKWLFVDDFQHTTPIQYELLKQLSADNHLFITADDAQSIYSFAGARLDNLKDAMKDSKVLTLQTNYRSTDKIVALLNFAIPKSAIPKELNSTKQGKQKPVVIIAKDDDDEAQKVVQIIEKHLVQGYAYKDIAVLSRKSYYLYNVQRELRKRHIPYVNYSDKRITDQAYIKDMISFLKIFQNPFDSLAWYRVLVNIEGIDDEVAFRVINVLSNFQNPLEAFFEISMTACDLNLLKEVFKNSINKPPSKQLKTFYENFYSKAISQKYESKNKLSEIDRNIQKLITFASAYASNKDLIDDITLSSDTLSLGNFDNPDNLDISTMDAITLSTVHQAVGKEWKIVFIVGVNPGDFPDSRSVQEGLLDEEERILYTAISRAEEILYISQSQWHKREDNPHKDLPDFVERLPNGLIERV